MPRIPPLLLIGVLVGLAILRPGNLHADSDQAYWLLSTLTAVAAIGYVAWRFHGLIPAAVAIALFRFADPVHPSYDAVQERANDAIFLATLALGIGVGSRQGRSGTTAWVLLAVLAAGIAYFGWFGRALPAPTDAVARDRLRHVTLALAALSILVALFARRVSWRDRARLIMVAVVIPALGVVAARLASGDWPRLLDGGEWNSLVAQWQSALRDGTWDAGAWCWTTPWVAGPLVLVGVWGAVARGRKGMKKGRPPLAWLVAAAGLGAIVALGARPIAAGSMALAAVGAILSVFGVADLILALVERVQLEPPEPGPSNVPRVK